MQAKIANRIFAKLSEDNPNPTTELNYTNNFTLLVAVMLSAQSTDISVNKATKELFKYCDTPEKIIDFGIEKLKNSIKTIGLYNSKAANIYSTCMILVEKYHSQIPTQFEQLIALPGVGVKTANVVLNCAFGQPTIAVDTHVYRVAKRLELASGNLKKVEKEILQSVPLKWRKDAHHLLILHGRYICTARNPKCNKCLISEYCNSLDKNI